MEVESIFFVASADTSEHLANSNDVVYLLGGGLGYSNFGDVLQLKGSIALWRRLSSREPVLLFDAAAITQQRSWLDLQKTYGCEHIVFSADSKLALPHGLFPIGKVLGGAPAHIVGGGYFNSIWGRRMVDLMATFISRVGADRLLLSGAQIDQQVTAALSELFGDLHPEHFGTRDVQSLEIARTSLFADAQFSFDDILEPFLTWRGISNGEPVRTHQDVRVGVHLNTTDYVGGLHAFEAVESALASVVKRYPRARFTMLQAYDDERSEVRDTLSSYEKFGSPLPMSQFDVVDIAKLSLAWDPADDSTIPNLSALRQLDFGITSSYHTAMLLHLLGVPSYLTVASDYYSQKAAIFESPPTFDRFLDDPRKHLRNFTEPIRLRNEWLGRIGSFFEG